MSDAIDWSSSEPPNRYVLAYGTQHCLIEQDYDHSIYGECEYIASRTLIKCKSVRKKADLKANGGICEMHTRFHDSIRNRFLCEERRLMQDNGQSKPKYSPFLNQEGLLCEEFPWLMPSYRWESPLPRTIYDDAPDDDPVAPLRHAGVYTEKDILKMRKALAEKKVEYLKLHGEMMVERARRRANDLFNKNGKVITLGETAAAVAAACASLDDYGYIRKRISASQKYKSGEWTRNEPPRCSFGKALKSNLSSDDHDSVSAVISAVIDCVVDEKHDFDSYLKVQEEKVPDVIEADQEVKQCTASAVPLSAYCIAHQMLDERQSIFFPCSVCHTMCIDIHSPPLCGKHLVDFAKGKRVPLKDTRMPVSPLINLSSGVPPLSPVSKIKPVTDPSKPLFGLPSAASSSSAAGSSEKRATKRVSIDVHPKEDNESAYKRFRTDVPPQMTVGEALTQGQSSAVSDAIRRAEMRRGKEDEVCSCARVRVFNRENFPPKPSVPRRIIAVTRPPVPVRSPNVVGGTSIQSPQFSRTDSPVGRFAAGSDQIAQRQLPLPGSRRFQQPQRFLQKDGRPVHSQPFVSSKPHLSSASPSTSTVVLDETGKEMLIEDRRTPPGHQNKQTQDPGAGRWRQPQAIIRQQAGIHYVREGSSNQESPRTHAPLPPPPDPPLLPFSQGYVRPIPLERGSPSTTESELRTEGGADSISSGAPVPRGVGVIHTREAQSVADSQSDQNEQLLAPPPPPPVLRPRFPTILRKTDGTPISPASAPPQQPHSLNVPQRPVSNVPLPRPPPASRPLPPHRLLNAAARPVPPHRLIKSLPLPVVPAPRAPKPPSNTDSTNASEQSQSAPATGCPTASSTSQSSHSKTLIDKANALSAADLDPLRILADVSEAARDSEASNNAAKSVAVSSASLQQSAPPVTTSGTNNGDDDDDFEEEL
ncbi:zf-C3Hc3H domain-containing protein [Trichostrongylus colubriformis]|uniref:Zf-C3Hc3H domain-containing protein n=1 Tax=Trichostrongylus colubriformis TaxID=6319 RepID=A0AAN8IG21_TRICO